MFVDLNVGTFHADWVLVVWTLLQWEDQPDVASSPKKKAPAKKAKAPAKTKASTSTKCYDGSQRSYGSSSYGSYGTSQKGSDRKSQRRNSNWDLILSDFSSGCFKCGESGHWGSNCFARC